MNRWQADMPRGPNEEGSGASLDFSPDMWQWNWGLEGSGTSSGSRSGGEPGVYDPMRKPKPALGAMELVVF
ncbi:hypothetical protein L1049_016210 [Liquidambar formosana]|uniref:Uncharacterized protein n=1 Tax=Liquidambar formosana TaxID=63359 RepID=A0AAP0X779_LIQFO